MARQTKPAPPARHIRGKNESAIFILIKEETLPRKVRSMTIADHAQGREIWMSKERFQPWIRPIVQRRTGNQRVTFPWRGLGRANSH
jgi:hypothetical protein